jgi:hypothetical protein
MFGRDREVAQQAVHWTNEKSGCAERQKNFGQ